MRTLDEINKLGGVKIDLRTLTGKLLLRRMALMPTPEEEYRSSFVTPLLGFVSMKHYIAFLEYPEEHLQ